MCMARNRHFQLHDGYTFGRWIGGGELPQPVYVNLFVTVTRECKEHGVKS